MSVAAEPARPDPGVPVRRLRVRLDLAYDGTDFHGWAEQPGRRTVEGVLTAALERVCRLPAGALKLTVAGRTDAGVHASGQVAHVDVPADAWQRVPWRSDRSPADALVVRLAGVLPADVRVTAAREAAPGFDARFSALSRRYAYRIGDHVSGVPPLRRRDVLWHRHPLEAEPMNRAAARLVGLHDFAAFCRRRDGATSVRTLLEYRWERDRGGLVVGHVVADAFCHSMVRALVGAVLPVGEGRRGVEWPAAVLAAATRDSRVNVVAPHGLTLTEVVYPDDAGLAARAREARNRRPSAAGSRPAPAERPE